jgi:UDP-glucose 4-epimerase
VNALVTGGAGFIGSHLVNKLLDNGENVHVLDNFSCGKEKNKNHKAHYIVRDIRSDLNDLDGYDVIFHLAALARIQPSFKAPLKTIDVNMKGTANVCNLAKRINAKVVYAGSSSFYAGTYLNPYAFSKWQGEEICKMFSKVYGLSTANARFFNVFGKGHPSTGPYATIVGIFEEQYKAGKDLTITGDGEQRRDFTHVDDIISGLILMSKKHWNGEIFNLGTGKNYSINELAGMYQCNTKYIAKRPGEANETLADISFSKKELDYKPTLDLKEYVEDWIEKNDIVKTIN